MVDEKSSSICDKLSMLSLYTILQRAEPFEFSDLPAFGCKKQNQRILKLDFPRKRVEERRLDAKSLANRY